MKFTFAGQCSASYYKIMPSIHLMSVLKLRINFLQYSNTLSLWHLTSVNLINLFLGFSRSILSPEENTRVLPIRPMFLTTRKGVWWHASLMLLSVEDFFSRWSLRPDVSPVMASSRGMESFTKPASKEDQTSQYSIFIAN